jgi:PAS domain S-box-containing protein
MIHNLLERQLRECTDSNGDINQKGLLQQVSAAYAAYERLNGVAESQKRFELALEGTTDGIWDWNVGSNTFWFSERARSMLGCRDRELKEGCISDWYNLIHGPDTEMAKTFIENHLKGLATCTVMLRFNHASGGIRHIMCRASAVADASGQVTRLVGVHTDVTAIVTVQEELEAARDKAEEARKQAEAANIAKSDFLANMSHEIRTPMNGVLGMAGLLLDTELDSEQRAWAEIIKKSGENLLEIINDILDLSKMAAGKLVLEPIMFDLHAVIMETTDLLEYKTQEKNVELLVSFTPGLPRYMVGDPLRLRQILLNLAGNAIKFTEKGYVLIKVGWQEEISRQLRLYFEIVDTGIGIPQEKLEHVFEKFSQAEESTTRRFGGTGLGLTICSKLVEMMGGGIGVRSESGKGSVFHFDVSLPRGNPVKARNGQIPDCDLTGLRALIVDDSQINGKILKEYLHEWNMRSGTCKVDKALTTLEENAHAGDPYHFVLVNYHSGDSNSMQLAKSIKCSAGLKHTIVCLLTLNPQLITSTNLLDMGFHAFFVKPYYPELLKGGLQVLWDAKRKGTELRLITRHVIKSMLKTKVGENSIQSDLFFGARILVADDMKINLMLMTKVLQKHGCNVFTAMNGRETVEMALKDSYDVIFMDCHMPEMDGFEATGRIRKNKGNSSHNVVIIALTADAMVGDREKCLEAGMDDYLNKPFRPEQVTQMLRKWIDKAA